MELNNKKETKSVENTFQINTSGISYCVCTKEERQRPQPLCIYVPLFVGQLPVSPPDRLDKSLSWRKLVCSTAIKHLLARWPCGCTLTWMRGNRFESRYVTCFYLRRSLRDCRTLLRNLSPSDLHYLWSSWLPVQILPVWIQRTDLLTCLCVIFVFTCLL